MLVSPGRNVRHADMQLLEHISMATVSNQAIIIHNKKKQLFPYFNV